MTEPRFELYKSEDGDWRWRLKAANGEVVASGEGYSSKQHAQDGVKATKFSALHADTLELNE